VAVGYGPNGRWRCNRRLHFTGKYHPRVGEVAAEATPGESRSDFVKQSYNPEEGLARPIGAGVGSNWERGGECAVELPVAGKSWWEAGRSGVAGGAEAGDLEDWHAACIHLRSVLEDFCQNHEPPWKRGRGGRGHWSTNDRAGGETVRIKNGSKGECIQGGPFQLGFRFFAEPSPGRRIRMTGFLKIVWQSPQQSSYYCRSS
jgi:hypothetical protein